MGMNSTIKSIDELDFTDDYMFCKVLILNPCLSKDLLELILDKKIKKLRVLNSQQSIEITSDGRGVRLDVYMEEDDQSVYDMEMQVVNRRNLPKRSRYYQGMIDLNLIERGADFNELKRSYVIFLCKFDPFGLGRHLYVFENICRDDPTLKLEDSTVKVFLNAYGNANDVSEEMAAFLQLLQGKSNENPLIKRIENAVNQVKSQKE